MFLVALVATLSVVILNDAVTSAKDLDPTTTSTMRSTYFGVDANDKEAVEKIQKQLGQEKWNEMMGDVDINSMNFEPNLNSPEKPKTASEVIATFVDKAEERLQKAVKKLHDSIFKPTTTTPVPPV